LAVAHDEMPYMSKPMKYAVAIIARKDKHPDELLVVKRPADDPDLGGEWGLPATSLKDDELPEEAARRICREKLGCDGQPVRFLGAMFQKRNAYDLYFIDIEVQIVGKHSPDVSKATPKGTTYVAQQWTTDPRILLPSALHGSCCSTLFLTRVGLFDRSQWIESLEGSKLVG
jgi:8-oxo-dGTP pyrophosphatase MutT (NUDIX family)